MIGPAFVLSAALAATPSLPAPVVPVPVPSGVSEWLLVEAPQPTGPARQAWQAVRAARIAPARGARWDAPGLDSEAFSVRDGAWRGEWTFFFAADRALPVGAWRLALPGQLPYRVVASLYCEEPLCAQLQALLQGLPAPAVDADPGLHHAWTEIVRREPCDPLARESRPYPRYPEEARGGDIEGRVELDLFHNACGDVREVTVRQSSGHPVLDRAAVSKLGRWRIQPRPAGVAGHLRIGVTFRLEDEDEPEAQPSTP